MDYQEKLKWLYLLNFLYSCCKVLIETDNIIKLFMTKLDQAAAFYKAVWTFVLK